MGVDQVCRGIASWERPTVCFQEGNTHDHCEPIINQYHQQVFVPSRAVLEAVWLFEQLRIFFPTDRLGLVTNDDLRTITTASCY